MVYDLILNAIYLGLQSNYQILIYFKFIFLDLGKLFISINIDTKMLGFGRIDTGCDPNQGSSKISSSLRFSRFDFYLI